MTADSQPASWSALAFRRSRHAAIIVGAQAPWVILDVNDAYLAITHKERAGLIGRALFDAFPQSGARRAGI